MKGLILTSPQNPLGIIYSEEELRMCIDWAKTNGLHLISDEIYALSGGCNAGSVCCCVSMSVRWLPIARDDGLRLLLLTLLLLLLLHVNSL